jgi:hypothetical protein
MRAVFITLLSFVALCLANSDDESELAKVNVRKATQRVGKNPNAVLIAAIERAHRKGQGPEVAAKIVDRVATSIAQPKKGEALRSSPNYDQTDSMHY